MSFRWKLADPQVETVERLRREVSLSPMLAQCLVNRSVKTESEARAFLTPRLQALEDPFLLSGGHGSHSVSKCSLLSTKADV